MSANIRRPAPFIIPALVFIACSIGLASAQESWRLADHPAVVERQFVGFTRPARSLTVAAEDAARVLSISLQAGQRIPGEPGTWTVVAELDSTVVAQEVLRTAAAAAEARQRVALSDSELAVAQREAQWWNGERDRIKTLVESGRAAQRDLDELNYRADSARLRAESAALQGAVALSAVAQAETAHQRAQLVVQRHQLRAPAGWVVAERLLEPGALVVPGQGLLQLEDVSALEIPLRMGEQEIVALRAQEKLELVLNHQGQTVAATVQRVDPRFDPVSRKRLVVLVVDGAQLPEAAGGIEVQLSLPIPDAGAGFEIPLTLVERRFDQYLIHLQDGSLRSVVPLRVLNDRLVISANALPAEAAVVPPPSSSPTSAADTAGTTTDNDNS